MKSRSFKLIKDLPDKKAGAIFTWDEEKNCYVCKRDCFISPYKYICYTAGQVEQQPDWFEEIKDEPILVTEDGKELYDREEYWIVNIQNWGDIQIGHFISNFPLDKDVYKIFSTRQAAETWIKENKPKWSDKDMEESFKSGERRGDYLAAEYGIKMAGKWPPFDYWIKEYKK